MNSFEILKLLRSQLAVTYDEQSRKVLASAIQHIEGQDRDLAELREDITQQEIPDED